MDQDLKFQIILMDIEFNLKYLILNQFKKDYNEKVFEVVEKYLPLFLEQLKM